MGKVPKISCLCVTNNRVEMLKRSIQYFRSQSYENKELVIVFLSTDASTANYVKSVHDIEIRAFKVPYREGITLGDLRNISISEAVGEYICIWDDDDWFHKNRLEFQFDAMTKNRKRASTLSHLLLYDRVNGDAYLSHRRSWENSLLCEKRLLTEFSISYPSLNRGEDFELVERIKKATVPTLVHQTLNPKLYVYCFTGNNTCEASHFDRIFFSSHKLPDFHSSVIKRALSLEIDMEQATALIDASDFSRVLPVAIDQDDVSLDPVLPADGQVLGNLMELNAHDMSPFSSMEMKSDCFFKCDERSIYSLQSVNRVPFLIRCRNKVVGFVVITRGPLSSANPEFDVTEFFVVRRYRQLGVGRRAAHLLWDRFAGYWSVRVSDGNKPAIHFWRTIVAEYSRGVFSEALCSGDLRAQRLWKFDNLTRSAVL
jgi:predicted acetyltransferase